MQILFTLVAAALLIGGLPNLPAVAQTSLDYEFADHDLDWRYWCPCQIDMQNAPVELVPDPDDSSDGIARITVDETSLGGNICRYKFECRSPANSLLVDHGRAKASSIPRKSKSSGPSLFRPSEKKLLENPYCTEEVLRRAIAAGQEGLCIQRQELRLQKPYQHEVDKPHLYSMRFRMPAKVEDRTHSIRWVIAQWKQEPLSDSYKDSIREGRGTQPVLGAAFRRRSAPHHCAR